MTDPVPHKYRWLRRSIVLVCITAGALIVLLQAYLLSPLATRQVSALLSQKLQRAVQLDGLRLALDGIELRGLRIANTPGLAPPWLLQAATISIGADWRAWLQGQRTVPSIAIAGPRLALMRSPSGQWNLQDLLRPFQGKEPGPEMIIGRLAIRDGSIVHPGGELRALQVKVTDLATRGSQPLQVTISGQDQTGATVHASGSARLGTQPSADLALHLATPLTRLQRPASPLLLDRATVSADIRLTLAAGELACTANGTVAGATVRTATGLRPLPARLQVHGTYGLAAGALHLRKVRLDLAELATVTLAGTVTDVKNGRRFAADLAVQPLSLASLVPFLPRPPTVDVAGQVAVDQVHLAGDRSGLQALTGRISLHDGRVSRHGKTVVQGVTAAANLVTKPEGWQLRGTVSQPDQPLLPVQRLQLPFQIAFSRTFALRKATAEPAVTLGNAPLTGTVTYLPLASQPLTGHLQVAALPLTSLAPLLSRPGFELAGGTASADLQLQGSLIDLTATVTLQGQSLAAKIQDAPAALAKLAASSAIRYRRGQPLVVNGSLVADGGRWRETPVSLATSFGYAERRLQLREVTAAFGEHRLTAGEMAAPLAAATVDAGVRQQPLQVTAAKLALASSGGLGVRDAQLSVNLTLQQAAKRRWLSGTGQLQAKEWQLRHLDQGNLRIVAESGAAETAIQLQGGALGGELTGTVRLDPFALSNGVAFTAQLTKADPTRLAPFLPKGKNQIFSGGDLAATVQGRYQAGKGLSSRFTLQGSELGLTLPNGTTALSGAGCQVVGEVSPELLQLLTLQVTLGPTLQLAASGQLRQPFRPERNGTFTLAPSSTPLSAWFDAFANLLPRPLQEAVATGDVSLAAALRLEPGKTLLDGGITFLEGGLDVPSQKLRVTGLSGRLPLTLATGTTSPPVAPKPRPERGDYPALLADLRRPGQGDGALRIALVSFGPLQLGPTTISSRAGNGLLEITHFESALLTGQLLGRGSVRLGGKFRYEADLLVHDLSLHQLCDAFPAIKGYLSGRVDGMLGLLGSGPGVSNLVGSVDLWTRSATAEQMLISKEFLQKLAGKKLKGYFFRDDRPFDRGDIVAMLQEGYLTFDTLDISHSTLGFRDLSVTVAAVQNRIALDHLLGAIKAAAERGKAAKGAGGEEPPPLETEFKWAE